MNFKQGIWWGVMALLAFSLASCRVKRPDTVLPDAKLEAVLYDYHIAKSMSEQVPYDEGYKRVLYLESVFRKHGITEAQFDTSMVWLARHPETLRDIYERVNERLKAEKKQVENLIALRDNKPKVGVGACLSSDRVAVEQLGIFRFAFRPQFYGGGYFALECSFPFYRREWTGSRRFLVCAGNGFAGALCQRQSHS